MCGRPFRSKRNLPERCGTWSGADTGLFNAVSERDGADSAVKDVFSLSEGKPV
jgi:hypothetical protein